MLEPLDLEIEGISFQFLPMDPFKAIELDKQVNVLLLPILGGLDMGAEGGEINLEIMARGLSLALMGQDNKSYAGLMKELLGTVTVTVAGQGNHSATSSKGSSVFQGNLILMYKIAFEVMKYNKFLPFGLSQLGPAIGKMLSSFAQK